MNRLFSLIVIFSIALSFDFGPNVYVAADNYDQKFPDIHIDENGIIHTVWVQVSGNSKNIYYSYSEDGGINFSESVRVNMVSNHVVAYVGAGPHVRTYGDSIYVIWADSRNGYNNTSIFLNRSINNGQNWIDEVIISDQPNFQLYGEIEVDDQGILHIIYYNYSSSLHFEDIRYSWIHLDAMMLYESISLGVTTDNAEPCDCCAPDMAVSPEGDLYIAYRNNISNIRDHYIVKKLANEDTFSSPQLIVEMDHYISYCPSSSPSIDVEGDQIFSGFMSMGSTNTYFTMGNTDLLFDNPQDVNEASSSSSQQNYPSVVLDNGVGHIAWVDFSSGGGDIRYGNLNPNTMEIMDIQTINDDMGNAMQTNPIIKNYNGNIYCVWADDRGADYQIYFASTENIDITAGDINQDDMINILDIVLLVNFILGVDSPDVIEQLAADMDSNGILNILDIVQIINIILV